MWILFRISAIFIVFYFFIFYIFLSPQPAVSSTMSAYSTGRSALSKREIDELETHCTVSQPGSRAGLKDLWFTILSPLFQFNLFRAEWKDLTCWSPNVFFCWHGQKKAGQVSEESDCFRTHEVSPWVQVWGPTKRNQFAKVCIWEGFS